MKFDILKRKNPNIGSYRDEDLKISYKFAGEVRQELGNLVKAVIIFGSTARRAKKTIKGDIDLLVIIDDVTTVLSRELTEAYRVVIQKIIMRTSTKLHIISLRFTSFWEYIKNGDPIGVNILRDGVALIDTGFFDPLQALLQRGRIRPTSESIWAYFIRAPNTLHNSKWHILQGTLDLYWSVIDAAHAALMKVGEVPPTPEHVADLLQSSLVKKKMLESKYVAIMRHFFKLMKMITHREVNEIKGADFDRYFKDAALFVARMRKIVEEK